MPSMRRLEARSSSSGCELSTTTSAPSSDVVSQRQLRGADDPSLRSAVTPAPHLAAAARPLGRRAGGNHPVSTGGSRAQPTR